MAPDTATGGNVVQLPVRPPAGGNPPPPASPITQHAPARAREDGGKLPRVPLWVTAAGAMQGASVIGMPPPAILTVWARHVAAARFYRHWWSRWPRYAFGAWHAWTVVPVLYFIGWMTDSLPKALSTFAVMLALGLLLPHITITITI